MKFNIKNIFRKSKKILRPEFEAQFLTSYAGMVIFEKLFKSLDIKQKLASCFRHVINKSAYRPHIIMLILISHILLGYKQLRDMAYYKEDEMVKRLLGLNYLPDISTISRNIKTYDDKCVSNLRDLIKTSTLARCAKENLSRITLDFDGTVQSTRRFAEGTAVGYNKKRKGDRSYYPLLCTIAQTGQGLDVHHRPGNVHDSNGAQSFILNCISSVKEYMPSVVIETRKDSAFFDEDIIDALDAQGVEFTASVPFARFPELIAKIEDRKRWRNLDNYISYFEESWRPKSWGSNYRFIFIRTKAKVRRKGVLQLDLFEPHDYENEYKVIVTNKKAGAKKVLRFHCGRGSQEGIIGEMKSDCALDYVPFSRKIPNQLFMLAGILAHNLNREMQMQTQKKRCGTTEKRASLWKFKQLKTIRKNIVQRAGRITKPQGKLKLTMNANEKVRDELLMYYDAIVTLT